MEIFLFGLLYGLGMALVPMIIALVISFIVRKPLGMGKSLIISVVMTALFLLVFNNPVNFYAVCWVLIGAFLFPFLISNRRANRERAQEEQNSEQ